MPMKKIILYLILGSSLLAINKLEFRIENDVLVSDGYYTSGLNIKYSYISKKDINGDKNYWNIVIGQKIFTPEDITLDLDRINEYERPYAGWIYLGLEKEYIYNTKSKFTYSFLLGLTGKNARAKETQTWVHKITSSEPPQGWSSQIEEIIGIQFNMAYTFKNIEKEKINNKKFTGEFTWAYEIGNIFINFMIAEKFKLNYFKDELEESDFYLFIKPSLKLNFYDATIQGAMFNDNSILTKDIEPLIGKIELGLSKTIDKFKINYSVNFHTPEVEGISWNRKDFFYHSLYFEVFF